MEDVPRPRPDPSLLVPPALPPGLEVVRPIGQGKMARVFLARETELDRLVAVKVLRGELAADETAGLRFEREARLAASLSHPNVVPVHRFGRLEDGTPYLVMSLVEGRTLAERLRAEGPMDEAEVRTLLAQLASALAAAHRKGIVHRDVRPANVLVEEGAERYLLADFGIAAVLDDGAGTSPRITRAGQILGEPRYAAPEQLRGETVTGQADIYGLAMLAYEVLTGDAPYRASTLQQWIAAHLSADPIPISELRPGVSPDLEDLLLRCLHREPMHRPRAEDVYRRLEDGMSAGTGPAPDAGSAHAAAGHGLGIMRRRIPQILSGTLAACVIFLGLVMGAVDIERLPEVAFELALNLVVWVLLAAGVLAWFHGEEGPQEMPALEKWILAALAAGWAASTALLLMWYT